MDLENPLPDPFVWRCVECGWVGPIGEIMVNRHDQREKSCPQCWALGIRSRVEKIPLSRLLPKDCA